MGAQIIEVVTYIHLNDNSLPPADPWLATAEEEARKLGVVVGERLVERQAVVAVGELEHEQGDVLLLVVKLSYNEWGVLFVDKLKKDN